jgi:hypothetical protein
VLGFFSSRPNWTLPPTHPKAIASPHPFGSEVRQNRLLERGWGGGPNSTMGQTLWYSRYMCTLWNQPRKNPFNICTPRVPICLSLNSQQGSHLFCFSKYIPKANCIEQKLSTIMFVIQACILQYFSTLVGLFYTDCARFHHVNAVCFPN